MNDIFELIDKNTPNPLEITRGHALNALMYADDLVMLTETEEQLQKNMNLLNEYCKSWNLEINLKKTKTMVFNRGNKLCNANIQVNDKLLECVKEVKYLGFIISSKNCSFNNSLRNLKIKANRAIFALNNKIKLSRLPTTLAVKIFNSQIKPILLYGSEVWAPFSKYDYDNWDTCEIEQSHTQFLKRTLGCKIQTPNLMIRAEVDSNPLLTNIISRSISFLKHLSESKDTIAKHSLLYELENNDEGNILRLVRKYYPDLIEKLSTDECKNIKMSAIKENCRSQYQTIWFDKIHSLTKAVSYISHKRLPCFEKYLKSVHNRNHKIALCRFRTSSHDLMIEKGRYFKPKIPRDERKCPHCKNEVENETHFLTQCTLYNEYRNKLYHEVRKTSNYFDNMTSEQKFIFIMTNENEKIMQNLAKYVSISMTKRSLTVS